MRECARPFKLHPLVHYSEPELSPLNFSYLPPILTSLAQNVISLGVGATLENHAGRGDSTLAYLPPPSPSLARILSPRGELVRATTLYLLLAAARASTAWAVAACPAVVCEAVACEAVADVRLSNSRCLRVLPLRSYCMRD